MFIPALVGLTLNFIYYRSIRAILSPIFHKVGMKAILFSVLYPLVFIACVATVAVVTGLGTFHPDRLSALYKLPSLKALMLGLLLIFGEEYGWRGFLLKELAAAKGKIISALAVGVVWALWHGPIVYGTARFSHMPNPFLLITIQMCAVFVFSIPFAYAYFLSNSILPPMIFHYLWNFFNPIVLGNIYQNKAGIVEGNLLFINGEGLAGIVFGLLFFIWYLYRFRQGSEQESE